MGRDNRRNYYRVLHVQPEAPVEIIRASYRTLMQRLRMHPDLGGDAADAALINEAYAVLTDPGRRAAYDSGVDPDLLRPPRRGGARAPDPDPPPATAAGEPAADARAGSGAWGPSVAACPFCRAPQPPVRGEADCARCGSPLERPRFDVDDGAWRRAVQRMPAALPLRYWTDWPAGAARRGTVVDLSPTGLAFVVAHPEPLGSFVRLASERFAAVARLLHCRPAPGSGWQLGAEFYTLRFTRPRGAFVSERA